MSHLRVVDILIESLAAVHEVPRVDADLLECLGDIHSNLRLEMDVCYERRIVALRQTATHAQIKSH